MVRRVVSLLALGLLTAGATLAEPPKTLTVGRAALGKAAQAPASISVRFGGTAWDPASGRWEALPDSQWTFDSGVGSSFDPSVPGASPFKTPGLHTLMEGWLGVDRTASDVPFFRRLGAADFDSTVCVGTAGALGGSYSLWAGALPAEAAARCYASGQGYGNQWNVSVEQAFWYDGVGSVALSFRYTVDSEPGFDFLRAVVDRGAGDVITVAEFTGTGAGLHAMTLDPGDELPAAPGFVTLRFSAVSDAAVSDEDGGLSTDCGLGGIDDVSLSGGGILHTADFESGNDGWVLSPFVAGVGDWSDLRDVADLPPPPVGPCAMADTVLVFFDASNGHPSGQDNVALSPWIDLGAEGVEDFASKTLVFDGYANLPGAERVYILAGAQWSPYTCPTTGAVGMSPLSLVAYSVPGGPVCADGSNRFEIDLSSAIPPGALEARIAVGVVSLCPYYPGCPGTSNASPWVDNVSLVVSDDVVAPEVVTARAERFTTIPGGPILPTTRWVEVRYTEPMGPAALDPARYTITNTPRTVVSVTADSVDAAVVHLFLSGTIGPSASFYDVLVTGVSDVAGNPIVENGLDNRGSFFNKRVRFEGRMGLFLRTQSNPPDSFAVEGDLAPLTAVLQDNAFLLDPETDGTYFTFVPVSLPQDKTTALATATLSWRFSHRSAGLEPRPDRTLFITAATGVLDSVSVYWNDQGMLSRQQARDLVIEEVIQPSPDVAELVGLFHHFAHPTDSLLMAGTTVAPYDSSFIRALDAPSYLVWLDNVPQSDFHHPTSFVFVDAASGDITVEAAESWPMVNGVEIETFAQGDVIWNDYGPPLTTTGYTPVSTTNTRDWAIIVVGENLGKTPKAKAEEKQARKNDIERIEEIMNGIDGGPKVDENKIIGVTGADTMGATLAEVCTALEMIKQEGCDKLYFWYIGHGGAEGDVATKDQDMSHRKLACKLLELNVDQVCVVIEACHSGTSVRELTGKKVKTTEGEKQLKGGLITSSSGNTSRRDGANGSFLIIGLHACLKDTLSDLDKNGERTLEEGLKWARTLSPILDRDKPRSVVLGDGGDNLYKKQKGVSVDSRASGTPLTYTVEKICYDKAKTAAGKDSLICRSFLYVENDGKDAVKGKKVYVVCVRKKGAPDTLGVVPIEVPAKRKVNFGEDGGEGEFPGRVCLAEIPDTCKSIKIEAAPVDEARYGLPLVAEVPDTALISLAGEARGYYPGETILYDLEVTDPPDEEYMALVSGLPSWGIFIEPPAFTTSAIMDTHTVVIRGAVPDTATTGGPITAELMNFTAGTTSLFELTPLVQDSAGVVVGPGSRAYQAVSAYVGLQVPSDSLRLEHTVVTFKSPAAALVGAAGKLIARYATLEADSGLAYTLQIAGKIHWEGTALLAPADGLHLSGAEGALWGGGVVNSQADGMRFSGDLQYLDARFCRVNASAGDGLVFDGATNAKAHAVTVEDSGDDDVVLRNGSIVELHDCLYDAGKEQVETGSTLTRSWTTDFFFANRAGTPLYGVIVEVRDALGAVVGRDTTDGEGFGGEFDLVEYVRAGATTTPHTPHQLFVEFLGRDTTCVYTADAARFMTFLLGDSTQTGTGGTDAPPAGMVLAQNVPNPAGASTLIRYGLPHDGPVRLRIFDVRGRLVETLVDRPQPAGWHEAFWNPAVVRGVYFYRLDAGGVSEVRKLLVLD